MKFACLSEGMGYYFPPCHIVNISSRLRKLMTEDLISIHLELRKSYGPEKSGCPQWMRWEKLELLPGKNRVWWMAVIQDCDDEYSLLVNLKRLYELQLSR